MEIPLLRDILVIFALSIFVLLACHKLKIPSVVGFLLTGVLAGPGGLGLIKGIEDVEKLSHIGIIFLLFTVGLEFSIKKILEYKKYFLIGGVLQVSLTVLLGTLVSYVIGRPLSDSFFLGFLLSLSSTAIVLKIIQDKAESDTPHGRAIVGILIFQDVVAIPMMLLIPILGKGEEMNLGWDIFVQSATAILLLIAVFFCALYLLPRLLDSVSKTRNRELFLLSVLVICFSVAWIAQELSLTLSMGAFLAGLIISDSEYSTEAIGDMLPFRDLFMSFFFVSIGMLCNLEFMLQNPFLILALCAGVIVMKACVAGISVLAVGVPLRTAVISALALSQIGEFSFVLAKEGFDLNLGTPFLYQLFLDVSLISMALTPFLINYSEKLSQYLLTLPLPDVIKLGFQSQGETPPHKLTNHVIIVGFGIAGKNLAKVLKETSIPYVILEMNSDTVKAEKLKGEPIHYGDASRDSVLRHVGIGEAKALAVVVNDAVAALRMVETAHKLNPSLYIIGRTRRVQEMPLLARFGASDVIPDEFGTSVEIFTRVLRRFEIPAEVIESLVATLRVEGYEVLRQYLLEPENLSPFGAGLEKIKLETILVEINSPLANKTILQSDLRKNCGITVMMIRRGNEILSDIEATTMVFPNDFVTVCGSKEKLAQAKRLFKNEKTPPIPAT